MNFKDLDKQSLSENCLIELISMVKQEALRSNKIYNASQTPSNGKHDTSFELEYLCGYAHASSRVISLMLQQAEAYSIPLFKLQLDDIDPEQDLMPGV